MDYRRIWKPGGCYFFTVVTYQRRPLFNDPGHILRLRTALKHVRIKYPFTIDAIVVMPDHLHCIWQLPENDMNYPLRWRLIKNHFSRGLHMNTSHVHLRSGEKPVWQRRYWEHCIRDEQDWRNHIDYIHYNPVKHGYVEAPCEWPYSSFHKALEEGWCDQHWGRHEPENISEMDFE